MTSSEAWSAINELSNHRHKPSPRITKLVSDSGEIATEHSVICNLLAQQFIVKPIEECNAPVDFSPESTSSSHSSDHMPKISHLDVELSIKNVKSSSFQDFQVPSNFLKLLSSLFSVPLALYFNVLLKLGKTPVIFKTARITPLYKGKGSLYVPSHYRPISSLTFVCKVFEHIIFKFLENRVQEKLNSSQHGFRQGRSCNTATSTFLTSII